MQIFLKKALIIFFSALTISGFTNVYSQDKAKVAAIFPFHFASTDLEEKEAISELNGLFYDLFAGQFAATGYFELVDRQHIDALMQEASLQQSGLTANQVVTMGKTRGAELALFGTVTKVYGQCFLTFKIIDIESSVILKAIKAKGSLKRPDELATEAGYTFMNGLSGLLHERYGVGAGELDQSSQKGIEQFLKARDLLQQAKLARLQENSKKAQKLQNKALNTMKTLIAEHPEFKSAVSVYIKRVTGKDNE